VYKLVWDDFCSSYLEMIKPAYQQPIDKQTLDTTVAYLENVLKVLHPFMPFITEEIWQDLKERKEKEYLIVAAWPKKDKFDQKLTEKMESVLKIVAAIRNIRNSKNIAPTKSLDLAIKVMNQDGYEDFISIIRKLANINEVSFVQESVDGAISFVEAGDEFFIPMEGNIDVEAERTRLQKELEYTRGFLNSVVKKLSNERFVSGAPEAVIANERKKQADAEAKINAIEQSLASL
jgi:valyl-tRNA synthetase